MPTLNWIGKDKVVNHHNEVPYRVLEHQYGFTSEKGEGKEKTDSGNKIIHGDNLEALKALLPEYEGKVNCIYIDPPYNTGNESWVYNDNVNHPKIKKWLGEVVGKEGDDLSRHDKWLCMMYPRLRLLHRLLDKDGIIFVSIDDNEISHLRLIMDEIFGARNFQQELIWKNKYGPGAMTKGIGNIHEYILCYSKSNLSSIEANLSETEQKKYKNTDDHYITRGGYITQPLATKSKDDRPNLVYPITYKGEEIWPDKQWIWSKERMENAIANDWLQFRKSNGKWSVRFKQYLKDEQGNMRKAKPISLMLGPFNQDGTKEINQIFGSNPFNNPKPVELISYLCSFILNQKNNKSALFLDSFAGSGSTAHAILNLNKKDDGNRNFILIEMEDYANSITAERIKKVIAGYGEGSKEVKGTGGSFDYYELGEPLFVGENQEFLNEKVGTQKIRKYIWYSETRSSYQPLQERKDNEFLLGVKDQAAYYFFYLPNEPTILDHEFLSTIKTKADQYIIYADNCLLSKDFMAKHNIIFKKIPRDITRF